MKKIFFFLTILSLVACHKNREGTTSRGPETGRFPFQTMRQTYRGDTMSVTIGDTIMYYTTAGFYNFDKPILLNGDTIGGVGILLANTIQVDTVDFNGGDMLLSSAGAGVLKLSYLSKYLTFFCDPAGYPGMGTISMAGIGFVNYSTDVMAAFQNDTLSNAADSAIAWSARAIRQYVNSRQNEVEIPVYSDEGPDSVMTIFTEGGVQKFGWAPASSIIGGGGGTGDGTLKGTMAAGRIPFGVDPDSLTTSANLTYKDDSLTGQFLDYLIFGDGTSGEIIEMEDGHIQLTSEMSYVHLWGDASSGDSISIQADDGIFLHDSLHFKYLNGAATGSRFVVLTSTGAADSGTLNNMSAVLKMSLSPVGKYLKDQQNGEVAFYHENKSGDLVKTYGLVQDEAMDLFEELQGAFEMSVRWIHRRVLVDNIQWVLIFLLAIGLYSQQRQIIKLRKK